MFDKVVIGVDNDDAGHDAVELAKQLASVGGNLSLVYVDAVGDRPAPDSAAVRDARMQAFARSGWPRCATTHISLPRRSVWRHDRFGVVCMSSLRVPLPICS